MSKTQKTSKKAKVLSALKSGKGVTRKTASTRFGVVNLRATIADLCNNDGVRINTNIVKSKGEKFVKYTLA